MDVRNLVGGSFSNMKMRDGQPGKTQTERDLELVKQRVEELAGARGDAKKSRSAIRRGELVPLAKLELQSKQIAASPTVSDYNRLQRDVRAIFLMLQRISNDQGNAVLPKP